LLLRASLVCWLGSNDCEQKRQGKEKSQFGRKSNHRLRIFFFI
jgi:hypothetical protein